MKKWKSLLCLFLSSLCLFLCVGCDKEEKTWTHSNEYLTLTVSADAYEYDERYRYFDIFLTIEIKKDFVLTIERPLVDENNIAIGKKEELLRWGFADGSGLLPETGSTGVEEITYTYQKGEKLAYQKTMMHWDVGENNLFMPLTVSGYLLLPNKKITSFITNVTIQFAR